MAVGPVQLGVICPLCEEPWNDYLNLSADICVPCQSDITHPVVCDTCRARRQYPIERLGETCGMVTIGGVCTEGTLKLLDHIHA